MRYIEERRRRADGRVLKALDPNLGGQQEATTYQIQQMALQQDPLPRTPFGRVVRRLSTERAIGRLEEGGRIVVMRLCRNTVYQKPEEGIQNMLRSLED